MTRSHGALLVAIVAAATGFGMQVTPSAQRNDTVTVTGCITDIVPTAGALIPVPATGPAAGTTGATPQEKAAERAGNVPDPHEGPAAAGKGQVTVPGGDRTVADTRTGGTGSGAGRDAPGATANTDAERGGHQVYFLTGATSVAEPGGTRSVGTSGSSAGAYRLDADNVVLAPHLNRRVRIVGTVQPNALATPRSSGTGSPVQVQVLRVTSVTAVADKCSATPE